MAHVTQKAWLVPKALHVLCLGMQQYHLQHMFSFSKRLRTANPVAFLIQEMIQADFLLSAQPQLSEDAAMQCLLIILMCQNDDMSKQ